MEIRVEKSKLKKAVSSAKKALAKVVIQEERGHLLFVVDETKMSVEATNNDLKARCRIPIDNPTKEKFSFTADPKILEKLLTKIDLDTVRLMFDPKDYVLKIYTTESEKSFSSLQSFPPDRMLTIGELTEGKIYTVNRSVLVFALAYASNYLAPMKEDQKQFDFVVIDKGIVYSANGSNKMGFIVFKAFEKVENFKIRKQVLPLMLSFVEEIEGQDVDLVETAKDIGVQFSDLEGNSMVYSCLKSNVEAMAIPKDQVKSEGPYTRIDKNKLLKVIDRLVASNPSPFNIGIELNLMGTGEDACLEINLVSSLKITETIPCARINDDNKENVSHIVDYRILKSILSSFDTDKEVRLHINENSRGYKVFSSGTVEDNKYILVGRGSYAKIIRQ